MGDRRALYLIRHGQTEWNLEKRLQGGKDSPLTTLGRKQAEAAGKSLRSRPPSLICASPLGRAKKTAEIVAKTLDIALETDERLGELRFGAAEGLTLAEFDRQWPGFRDRRERDKWHVRWPEGESYLDVDTRIASYIEETLDRHLKPDGDQPLAVVGHETINMILMGRLLALDPAVITRIGQPNHVIYRLERGLVDHAYLGDDQVEWIPGMLQKRSDDILHVHAAA